MRWNLLWHSSWINWLQCRRFKWLRSHSKVSCVCAMGMITVSKISLFADAQNLGQFRSVFFINHIINHWDMWRAWFMLLITEVSEIRQQNLLRFVENTLCCGIRRMLKNLGEKATMTIINTPWAATNLENICRNVLYSREISGTDPPSHITPIGIAWSMGMVWVPLRGGWSHYWGPPEMPSI